MANGDKLTLGTEIAVGSARTIVCLRLASGQEPALRLLDDDVSPQDRKKLIAAFQRVADTGRAGDAFRPVGGTWTGLVEFRAHQARLIGWTDAERRVILADGEIKKRDKLNPALLAKVERWRREYLGQAR